MGRSRRCGEEVDGNSRRTKGAEVDAEDEGLAVRREGEMYIVTSMNAADGCEKRGRAQAE